MWQTVLFAFEDKIVIDPSQEEMYIANNLISITLYESGKQLIDKSLSVRTFTGQI